MATTDKKILSRIYVVSIFFGIMGLAIAAQIARIQFVEGDEYRAKAEQRIFRTQVVDANRGNLYDANGQLLATSISKYDIRFDAVAPSDKDFNAGVDKLSSQLSRKLNKPKSFYLKKFRRARATNSRYLKIASDVGYSDLMEIKSFALFNRGAYRGGLIVEPHVVREYPLGKMAERLVGYDEPGKAGVGLEGAYSTFLKGENGSRLVQKISGNQWKPIDNVNEIEPQDGLDVYSTIDVNMQDVAHHALLEQLEYFEADHGTAVVMEVATGEIKALSNLGRASSGKYYEKRNYALWESHEPGSTFKLMSVIAALEDKVVDTSTVFDTQGGKISYYGRNVRDSKYGGYGKISVAKAFEVSSNTALVQMIQDNYSSGPERYVDRLYSMNLHKKLELPIIGEGRPFIPHPDDQSWSGLSLPWMGFGYGVQLTPLQTLTFYNAVANDGVMVKPRLIKEVRSKGKTIEQYDREILNPSICSQETIDKVKVMMENVVRRGTADNLYSKDFSMAGKTGTCQTEYWKSSGNYIASFAGYFPADKPLYSCIVVIHKPDVKKGYYGNIVAGPVFKKIAQKIYASNPQSNEVAIPQSQPEPVIENINAYYTSVQKEHKTFPDVTGMDAMDAITILENLGARVIIKGKGKVKGQSIKAGLPISKSQQIILTLS
ncbi:penicillin-binding protein [Nonlabens ponticola]|uniref:PASTA domain-containing protein n=1 Tax=Nonlabens ponticola TaxID=2496866 RepID=A0A3S9N0M7_9FLAO|nr:penicillin-binding protein [Nonlabens ponticola]AZQ45086.1 PASTA domain-containing protein [Nonlabens ponticola]